MVNSSLLPTYKMYIVKSETEKSQENNPTINEEINFAGERILRINPEKKPLTIEILRSFSGFESVTDEEANEIISSLQIFSELFHEYFIRLEKMKASGEISDIPNHILGTEEPSEEIQCEQPLKRAA